MTNQYRKKRGPWIDIALISTIFILIGAIFYLTKTENLASLKSIFAKGETIASTFSKTEKASDYPGVIIITEQDTDEKAPYTIEYPETVDETINETIHNYIEEVKSQYKSAVQFINDNSLEENIISNLTIQFETFIYEENYYSFKFIQKQSLQEGEHSTIKTIFYDRSKGQVYTLANLFSDDKKNLETFATHIRSLLSSKEEYKSIVDPNKLKNLTTNDLNIKHFTIQNEDLVIYFDEDVVAAKDHGVIRVAVPLSFLNPILSTEFQREMAQEEENILVFNDNIKRVALTFDDGPHPVVTTQILNHLDNYNAKATFFMLGNRIQHYPEVAKDVLTRGHEVGNHTWSHPLLTRLSMETIMQEFNSTEQMIVDTLGINSSIFRPPYGVSNDSIDSTIPRPSVNWTIDTLDWKHRNANQSISVIKKSMHNNAIILMHDIHQSTADGLPAVLEFLQAEGYQFVTVSELLSYQNQ